MNKTQFNNILNEQLRKCEAVLMKKGKEYNDQDDYFLNLKEVATLMQCSNQYALGGMMSKHIISIYDMLQNHIQDYSIDQWDEKITDAINYLIILKAIVCEENKTFNVNNYDEIFSSDQWNCRKCKKLKPCSACYKYNHFKIDMEYCKKTDCFSCKHIYACSNYHSNYNS